MSTGAQRADAQPEDGTIEAAQHEWLGFPSTNQHLESEEWTAAEAEERPARVRTLSLVLLGLAALWTGTAIWSILRGSPELTIANLLQWVTFVSPPLILMGVAWMLLGQTPRRETERFTRAISAMKTESTALESVLTIVAARLEENHSKLRNEAAKLMSLGDEASDRLGRVAHYLSRESATLDKKSAALEAAAEAARVDLGVLLSDLPRAEDQARAVAQAIKQAGLTAHEQAGALEAQLSVLTARGREADEQVGGAAQRLGAHLARVESTTAAAATRMEEAASSMNIVVDGTMARAAEALEATRASIDAQGAAALASIEQNRAAFEHAGEEAARNLAGRLEAISGKIELLAGHLAAQDAASHLLLNELSTGVAELDRRFAELRNSGTSGADLLNNSFGTVRVCAQELFRELSSGHDRAKELIDRAHEMAQALTGVTAQLNGDVPAALGRVQEEAERTREATSSLAPRVAAIEATATSAAAKLAETEASIARHQEAFQASGASLASYLTDKVGEVERQFALLRDTGRSATDQLQTSIASVRSAVSELAESLDGGQSRAAEIEARARDIDAALTAITAQLTGEIPSALVRVEEQAEQARQRVVALEPSVSAIEGAATKAAAKLAESETSIARHQEAFADLTGSLVSKLAEAEDRLAMLHATGSNNTAHLDIAISAIRQSLAELTASLDQGQSQTDQISARAEELNSSLAAIRAELEEHAPAALSRFEEQAERARASTSELLPQVQSIEIASSTAAARIAEAEQMLAGQQQQLDALLARINEGVGTAEAELRGLSSAASAAEGAATKIVTDTAPELVEALLRVREASNQAASHAREAIASVIPQSATALAEASSEALNRVLTNEVQQQIGELGQVSERAIEAARAASERLTRQMLKIGESAAAIEARIDEARREREAKDSENFSRRVALLIESLNSTAIDVTKILSNEVTDSAWAAYLKGDRGVFTRRAVRLLDNSEAREIVQHYDNEPEFREQVNRYIHDFESMLRRILADRDSSALGVTILSSDMGKLYVALAQAIERLR